MTVGFEVHEIPVQIDEVGVHGFIIKFLGEVGDLYKRDIAVIGPEPGVAWAGVVYKRGVAWVYVPTRYDDLFLRLRQGQSTVNSTVVVNGDSAYALLGDATYITPFVTGEGDFMQFLQVVLSSLPGNDSEKLLMLLSVMLTYRGYNVLVSVRNAEVRVIMPTWSAMLKVNTEGSDEAKQLVRGLSYIVPGNSLVFITPEAVSGDDDAHQGWLRQYAPLITAVRHMIGFINTATRRATLAGKLTISFESTVPNDVLSAFGIVKKGRVSHSLVEVLGMNYALLTNTGMLIREATRLLRRRKEEKVTLVVGKDVLDYVTQLIVEAMSKIIFSTLTS